jgi:hypothetical protein
MDTLTPEQQKQLEALQQAEMRRQLQRQQVLLNNGAGGLNAAMAANKKQREVYVGNLAIGAVSELMLRELFNAALAHFVADPVTRPPVVSTTMDGSGRFGFVELRTEELAEEAMKLDKVNLGGREINVGRPKGYIEPPPGSKIDPNKVRLPFLCATTGPQTLTRCTISTAGVLPTLRSLATGGKLPSPRWFSCKMMITDRLACSRR